MPRDKKEDQPPPPEEVISEKEIEAQKTITMFPNKFSFGHPTKKNVDALRTLTYTCLPVHYRDWFYDAIFDRDIKLCRCVYFNDILVGAICTRIEEDSKLYIMSITVLENFRHMNIGSYLMKYTENYAQDHENIKIIYLNVHTINTAAINFYTKKFNFTISRKIDNYYSDLTPSSCYELVKTIRK